MTNTINYAKYANMTQKQLFNSLENAKKKRAKLQTQANDANALIDFLTDKIKDSLNTLNVSKNDFISLKDSGLVEKAEAYFHSLSSDEQARFEKELNDDIDRNYDDEL
ncbi:hypothetical protein [Helicobacter sp. T3_23-1056]